MRTSRVVAAVCGTVCLLAGFGATATQATPPPAVEDVMLSEVGSGFVLVDEQVIARGALQRTFQNGDASLFLTGFAVTTPPGVWTVFEPLSNPSGFDTEPESSLELAVWIGQSGPQVGAGGAAVLTFASRDHIFTFRLEAPGVAASEVVEFLRALAGRQVAEAGGGPRPEQGVSGERTAAEAEVEAMLPDDPPAGYGLTAGFTAVGQDELDTAEGMAIEVQTFLNDRSTTATRLWFDDARRVVVAVNITRYPYDIFAAASVGEWRDADDRQILSRDAIDDVPDVVAFAGRGAAANRIGTVFRRGDVSVLVFTERSDAVPAATAAALAADMTRLVAAGLPPGATDPYQFPETPSKLLGLGLTAVLVIGAAGGTAMIARIRANRVRRRWSGGALPPPVIPVDGARPGTAIDLDPDARRLRRQGAIIAGGQMLAVTVSIVALAGDFAWPGVAVAAVAFLAGLLLTSWWQRRELGLLGAKAPPRELVLPRPVGALVGAASLALVGFGVAYLLKGVRYLVLPPSLAQLKWSDLLGIAPRTVGIVFAIGGFVVFVLGGWLFRIARALSRAGTSRVLRSDGRPAALYLRSFDDDSVPLPTIASARRPLLELFSIRGADPFEESLAWELNAYGPVVAVGRPGRSLTSLGAAREHLPDETWREQVANRMDAAGIIAVATGESDGLAWELGQVVSGGHLSKTFFVFPPVAPDAIGRRWAHTVAALAAAGRSVGPLPVPAALVHTVRIDADGTTRVTYASRRDEATYRTGVDHALETDAATVEDAQVATPAS